MIKRQKIDLSEERRILSYMITSTSFLSKLQEIAEPMLFQSSYSRTVASWIWEYFSHTQEAPNRAIEEVYIQKQKAIHSDDDREMIEQFLNKLSKDWEKVQVQNVEYTTKNAIEYFKIRSLERLKLRLEEAIDKKDSHFGERLIGEYKKVERPVGRSFNLLEDEAQIISAFSHEDEYLFSFPGALGEKLGAFMRGDFFGINATEKGGKSFYMWYTAYRAAMIAGLRTIFFSFEMTDQQMIRRMWKTMCGLPLKTKTIMRPYFKRSSDEDYEWEIKFEKETRSAVDLSKIKKKQKEYLQAIRTGEMRLITYPSHGATVQDIETDLANLEYFEGFVPDVIVVDYADIVRPGNERTEYRHQLDRIWKALRGLAQKKSALVVTGSQVNEQGRVSEDKRKLGHVTKMIKLNQTDDEYEDGIMRIKTVVQREGKRFTSEIVVLQDYDIGRPYLDSRIKDEVNLKKYEE